MSIKAFELVPAIERFKLMSEKALTQIVCIESCGKNIYIGTDDCFVVHYLLEEQTNPMGKMTFSNQKQGHKYLGVKKPVLELKAASALNRLMVLCDSTLSMLNMMDLEPVVGGSKIRSVTTFCVNGQPLNSSPFSVEICVALKRKSLQLYIITEERVQLMKDISTLQPPLTMALAGEYLCVATTELYSITNIQTGHTQELFPFDSESLTPSVTNISRGEFLLSAPSALGMFALATGASHRPPLQWSENLISVAYHHPYVLALNDEFITIHSILDQQQKQSLPFQGGRCLGHFDGRLFVASLRDIYALVPVPVQKQLQSLLSLHRVHEALDLAQSARKMGALPANAFQRIQLQAAFIEFAAQNFEEAKQLFLSVRLDIRELLSLYPHLLPVNCDFTRQMPPLHDMADIYQVAQKDPHRVRLFQEFLLAFLQELDASTHAHPHRQEIHCALLKLYAELDPASLGDFLASGPDCFLPDCLEHLAQHGCHHARALLLSTHGQSQQALIIWRDIVDGVLTDDAFPGLNFLVQFITSQQDGALVWSSIDWLLERDQLLAVKLLISSQSSLNPEDIKPDGILDKMAKYPDATVAYLEFIVLDKKLPVEKYHTLLSVLYLDEVLQILKVPCPDQTQLEEARKKLRHLLQASNLYRVQLILGKIKQTELYSECAILYSKLEEHDRALRLLVHKVRDYQEAEAYCLINSEGKDPALRTRLFHLLLAIYLDSSSERRDALVAPAIDLLNKNRNHFNTAKVLELIPDSWSVGLLSHFLTSSVRAHLHRSRTARLQRMLARAHHLQLKECIMAEDATRVDLREDVLCAVCGRDFSDGVFARYPNGVLVHVSCMTSRHVCPVTGRIFGTPGSSSKASSASGSPL